MGCIDSQRPPRGIDTPGSNWMESMNDPGVQIQTLYRGSLRIHYSGHRGRKCISQTSDFSISRSRQENISSSEPELQISTPNMAYLTSCFPIETTEGSWNASKNVGILPSYADSFSSEVTSADECAVELNFGEILATNGTKVEIFRNYITHSYNSKSDIFDDGETPDLEHDNLPPIETMSKVEDSSQSCINKVLKSPNYGVVEGEFSDSEGTIIENEEVISSADSYGQLTPVSGQTSERFDHLSGKLRTKVPQTETHDLGIETTSRTNSEDTLEFAQQEVNRTQNVASVLSEKLDSMSPLLQLLCSIEQTGSQSPSVLSLEKHDNIEVTTTNIDDLDKKINDTSKFIQFLRARSVSILTGDESADDFLTSSYQEVEREIFSLQDHRLELEKEKGKLLGNLQLQILQSLECGPTNDTVEFQRTVEREVCTSDVVLPEECFLNAVSKECEACVRDR